MASLWGRDAAVPVRNGVGPTDGLARDARSHATAAGWRHHAERRGCVRAVSGAAVASLVDLLTSAGGGVEPSQVTLP